MTQDKRKLSKKTIGIIAGIGGTLVLIVAIITFILLNFFVEIELKQEQSTLEYGQEYKEEAPKAYVKGKLLFKKGKEIPCKQTGKVDQKTVGKYEITYEAKKFIWEDRKKQTIEVVDTIAPEIVLNEIEGHYTLPNAEYEEEGFQATDNYDGDITDKVVREIKDGKVYYSVKDSSGNAAEAVREILYNDPEGPVLTLKGEEKIVLYEGDGYEEPGFEAADNVDGDLTDKVMVEGSVNPAVAGNYEVTYTVSDSFGNVTTKKRKVTVKPVLKQQTDVVIPGSKIVYLTFDDGPGPYTAKLLDVLDKYQVKATFFCVNGKYNYLIGEEAARGHSVGIHTMTHKYNILYASDEAYFEDLNAMHNVIREQIGHDVDIVRFPGGGSNTISRRYSPGIMSRLAVEVQNAGFQYFDWNVSSGDAGGTKSTAQVAANVINGIQKHDVSVVLQHDIHGFSVDAVEQILQWGLENGYTFLPLEKNSFAAHQPIGN